MKCRDHIYLVGFMGSGKSTVGPLLAEALGRPFHDLDAMIVDAVGLSIPQIFERLGEEGFRRLEREALERTSALPPSLIALGGGAFSTRENRALVAAEGSSIWLRVSMPEASRRCLGDVSRPLARDAAAFERLYRQRLPDYRKADLRVDVDSLSPQRLCNRILRLLSTDREAAGPDPS